MLFCLFPVSSYRWLKFEEDVEDGGERWSKPYVATLSLHSLFELRSCIMNGTVMLDMRANSLEEIAGKRSWADCTCGVPQGSVCKHHLLCCGCCADDAVHTTTSYIFLSQLGNSASFDLLLFQHQFKESDQISFIYQQKCAWLTI